MSRPYCSHQPDVWCTIQQALHIHNSPGISPGSISCWPCLGFLTCYQPRLPPGLANMSLDTDCQRLSLYGLPALLPHELPEHQDEGEGQSELAHVLVTACLLQLRSPWGECTS